MRRFRKPRALIFRTDLKCCLISTSRLAGLFDIFMLLHIWQNCVCFGDFLPMINFAMIVIKKFHVLTAWSLLDVKSFRSNTYTRCPRVRVNRRFLWTKIRSEDILRLKFDKKTIFEILFPMVCFVSAESIVFSVWCVLLSLNVNVGCILQLLYHPWPYM